jgi:hypothetical protein
MAFGFFGEGEPKPVVLLTSAGLSCFDIGMGIVGNGRRGRGRQSSQKVIVGGVKWRISILANWPLGTQWREEGNCWG